MRQLPLIIWVFLAIAIGYLFILLLLYLLQNSLTYHPARQLVYTPDAVGLNYEDTYFDTKDGIRLHGWHIPAANARGTVLFSHGNAGNISGRLETIRMLHGLDLNVLIYDYRGYGKSEGRPDEAGTYRDAQAAWNFLTGEKNIPESAIVIMGRSLGGAVSAWLATRVKPAGLILESTFTSAKDLAQELYPWVPVRWLIKIEYPTKRYLQDLSVPKLILHSRDDRLIPFHHGREIFESVREPKDFFEMSGDHGGGHIVTGADYVYALDRFLDKVFAKNNNDKESD